MTRPLTSLQRRALTAVDRGQIRPAPTRAGIDHPELISPTVLRTCRQRGWWTWAGPRATLTPEGRAALNTPVPEPVRNLHTGLIGSDRSDRCAACNHVRGTHGIHPLGQREHLDCLHAGCDCSRFVAADEDTGIDHGYIAGHDRLEAGEGVDEDTQEQITAQARRRDAARFAARRALRQVERAPLGIEDRLQAVQRDARREHVDVTGEVWLIKRMFAEDRDQAARERLLRLESRFGQRAA